MARRAFLGIDCGTRSTKALLIDATSEEVLGLGRAPHELVESADGTREQHPDWWLAALQSAVREALAAGSTQVEVAGMGVSGQQHGLVCLDAADRPVRPAKLWNDTTTAAECDALTEQVGGFQAALDLTGNTFLPGYTAPKVLWLRRHEPPAYRATRRLCLPHDYLNLWLTGTFATEPGDASGTAYFDVRQRQYSAPVTPAAARWGHASSTGAVMRASATSGRGGRAGRALLSRCRSEAEQHTVCIGWSRGQGVWPLGVRHALKQVTGHLAAWRRRRPSCVPPPPIGAPSGGSWPTRPSQAGIEFATADCRSCPSRPRCTRAATEPREMGLRPRAQQEALWAARQRQTTASFREEYARRAGVEGTLSQAIHVCGLRRARCIGLAKTRLQHIITAAALNVVRTGAWLAGFPRAQTRQAPFVALALATCPA